MAHYSDSEKERIDVGDDIRATGYRLVLPHVTVIERPATGA